ncbi:MAG TPA: hypothetical protein QGF02_00635 [Candidatus Babeliales bacterium]|nr:hypothetical protein [Candidatus Babeliales bacterium]
MKKTTSLLFLLSMLSVSINGHFLARVNLTDVSNRGDADAVYRLVSNEGLVSQEALDEALAGTEEAMSKLLNKYVATARVLVNAGAQVSNDSSFKKDAVLFGELVQRLCIQHCVEQVYKDIENEKHGKIPMEERAKYLYNNMRFCRSSSEFLPFSNESVDRRLKDCIAAFMQRKQEERDNS